jgi:hypothetical protein
MRTDTADDLLIVYLHIVSRQPHDALTLVSSVVLRIAPFQQRVR